LSVALGYDGDEYINMQNLMAAEIEDKNMEGNFIINVKQNLDLIPSNLELAGIEMTLVNVMSRELILKQVIEKIETNYDYIIIDCPPSLGMLTINALTACDTVIIPVDAELFSVKGLALLTNSINKIRKRLNPKIEVDGILITRLNQRTNLSKNMLKTLDESVELIRNKFNLDIKVFENKIPASVRAGEAISKMKSVIEYDPEGKVSEAYQFLAREWGEV
jgi:chromosome partitioning protein